MSIVLQRIQGEIGASELCCLGDAKRWRFTERLWQLPERAFQAWALKYRLLHFDYRIQCAQIAHDLSNQTKQMLEERIKDALATAELLAYLYQYYNHVPREALRLNQDQRFYRQWLSQQGYIFPEVIPEQKHQIDLFSSQFIRYYTTTYNFFRLFSVRLRRFMVASSLSFPQFEGYRRCVQGLDAIVNPVFSYFAWIFFVPRLLNNLVFMAKHMIPGPWMFDEEKKLGWQVRSKLQIERRWYELGNDLAWFSVGFINCFVFTGVLAPAGIYLAVVLQVFDVVWACMQAWFETNHMQSNHHQYQRMMDDPNLTMVEKNEISVHLKFSEACMAYEKKKLNLRILNTVIMLIAVGLGMPFLAVNPLLPLIGAAIAVLASGFIYGAGKTIEKNKLPESVSMFDQKTDQTTPLARHSLFSANRSRIPPQSPDKSNFPTSCSLLEERSSDAMPCGAYPSN